MNEKLGKEIERKWKLETHMCKQSDFIGVFFLQKDYEDFARYFYNLALADVREKVEKHIKEEDGFNDVDGYRIALKSIRNFIDE